MSRTITALTFIAACVAVSAALAQGVPQPVAQPQLNPAQPQYYPAQPQYNPAQQQPQYNPAQAPPQYNPAQVVNPQLQQQLTPDQQQQLERARQAQLQPRPGQPQFDPRFQPAQYQPPVQPGQPQPGQLQPGLPQPLNSGIAPNGQPGQPGMPTVQMQPARAPFQLTPQEEQQLDMTLKLWETSSGAVKTFHADFTRWEYDPVWGPKDAAKTEASGVVRYQAPDKGLFKIESAKNYNTTTNKYEPSADINQLEHWVCDGTYVFHVDHKEKKMRKTELPPNMRGTQIADGPLPFVFGQKADKLKARYWVKIATPPGVTDQIWLEAYPKYQADAANDKKVEIILDAKKLTPLAIQTHDPNPKTSIRNVYRFSGHEVNGLFANNWFKNFIQPDVPSGYKLIEEPYSDPSTAPPQQKPLQATVPGGSLKK
jgi:TIGR03009 family protein